MIVDTKVAASTAYFSRILDFSWTFPSQILAKKLHLMQVDDKNGELRTIRKEARRRRFDRQG
jgi:hypothetical protein